jgi:hypothetical protein
MPVLPLGLLMMGLAYTRALRRLRGAAAALAVICLLGLLLQGGGAGTFIVRSDERWYWPDRTVLRVNQATQRLLKIFVIGS